MKPKKGGVEKIRPYVGDMEIAQKIADLTGLDRIEVLSLALSAGLKAIKANGYRVPLPLKFELVESPILSEPDRVSYQPEVIEDRDRKKKGSK